MYSDFLKLEIKIKDVSAEVHEKIIKNLKLEVKKKEEKPKKITACKICQCEYCDCE